MDIPGGMPGTGGGYTGSYPTDPGVGRNLTVMRGTLPREPVCTENLIPLIKMLPCRSKARPFPRRGVAFSCFSACRRLPSRAPSNPRARGARAVA